MEAALEAFDHDPQVDGCQPTLFNELTTTPPAIGPRQLLLESAPCHACQKDIPADSHSSVVCDRCNQPFHFPCAHLTSAPSTYWYCAPCTAHHHATGYTCPTQDITLQRYLLGETPPADLADTLASASRHLTWDGSTMKKWVGERWLPWPPKGLQILLLEESHV